MTHSQQTTLEKRVISKVGWRIVPFVFILYIVNYIDRANIGYASLQMNSELALTSQAFGLAAGLFFIGYFLAEVPSNVFLAKFGARKWIARILLTWGALAVVMGFVQNDIQLYIVRFLLGVAEAGFFPGIIVYLGAWFPARHKATMISFFVASIPVSYIISSPLSTWIMSNVSWFDMSGWRWMFVLEGIPAVLLGFVCLFFLIDSPAQAKWLTIEERGWLLGELQADADAVKDSAVKLSVWKTIINPKVLYLSTIYFIYQVGSLGVGYWLPKIISGLSDSLSTIQIGLIGMIPYIVAAVVMVVWSRNSDRTGERQMHCWLPLGASAISMFLAAWMQSPVLVIAAITLALTGLYAFKSPFWVVPNRFLDAATAGTAVAVINSIGNLGGFVGPYAQGVIVDGAGSARAGLYFFGILLVIATAMMVFMKLPKVQRQPSKNQESAGADA